MDIAADTGPGRSDRVAKVFRAAAPSWVVTGTTYREGEEWLATVEVYDGPDREPRVTLRSRGARASDLAGSIADALATETGAPSLAGFSDGSTPLAPRSDEALAWVREADRARKKLEFSEAMQLYERALSVEPEYSEALVGVADAYFRAGLEGKARDAIASARAALAAAPGGGHPRTTLVARALEERIHRNAGWMDAVRSLSVRYPDEPEILLERSLGELASGDAEAALRSADRAAALDPLDGGAQIARHRALGALKRPEEAGAALDRARALFRAAESEEGLAQAEEAAGYTAYRASRFDEARQRYAEAGRLYRLAGLPARAAVCESVVGDTLVSQWNVMDAIPIYTAALSELERAGHYGLAIQTLNSIGGAWIREGRAAEAEDALTRALDEARKLGVDDRTISPLLNLSTLYAATGRAEDGLRAARRAVEIATRANDRRLVALGTLRVGLALREAGRLAEAVEALQEVVDGPDFKELDAARQSLVLGHLAEILEAAERPQEAIERVERAIALIPASPPTMELAFRLCCRARLHAEAAEFDAARADLATARDILAGFPPSPEGKNLPLRSDSDLVLEPSESRWC